ncbi:MAG: CDP-glycerol glycerophosphotransferase family protein [Clostridiales Family XIII bacterium]|jgi:hypothetical protein|nr:CDP-glycerol glycerophosphotransferase family protein [Clostridiales Family XIII bacterium]
MIEGEFNNTSLTEGEKIRIVFLFQIPSFWPSWESVYRACVEDERYDVRLVLLDELAFSKVQMAGAEEFLIENALRYTRFGEFDFSGYKPHIVMLQSPYTSHRVAEALSYRFVSMGTRVVYIPYGIEISDTPLSRVSHFYTFAVLNAWRIYVISEKMAEIYKEYCPNRFAIRVTGLPRFDAYSRQNMKPFSKEIERLIGNRKVILWKMHFPKTEDNTLVTPNLDEYLKFARTIEQIQELFFVFMPHPIMLARQSEFVDQISQEKSDSIIDLLREAENVYVYEISDYRPAILRADAVIIDRSALMIEAPVTGVPILYMYNPDNVEEMTEAIRPLVESFYQGTGADDMCRFIEMFQNGDDPKKEERAKAFRKCVPYTDGKCGERVANDMVGSLISEKTAVKQRIAIFAVGKVLKYYWNETAVLRSESFEIIALSDNNASVWDTDFNGIPIVSPEGLRDYDFDLLVIFSEQYFKDIYKQLVHEVIIDIDKIMRFDKFLIQFCGG